MEKSDCRNEKFSSRTIGLIIIPFGLMIGFIGSLILPVVGLVFALPLLALAAVFIAAPESRVCKLILRKEG